MTTIQIGSHEVLEKLLPAIAVAQSRLQPTAGNPARPLSNIRDDEQRLNLLANVIGMFEINRPFNLSIEDAILINKYQS